MQFRPLYGPELNNFTIYAMQQVEWWYFRHYGEDRVSARHSALVAVQVNVIQSNLQA